jgi:hypothetical protein
MSTDHDFDVEHEYAEPLLAEHALGTADVVQRARIDAHLVLCAACRATFVELTDAVSGLEQAVHAPVLEPRAGARESLLAAAQATPQVAGEEARAAAILPRPIRRRRRFERWIHVALPVAVGAFVLVGVFGSQARKIDSLERSLEDARGDQVPVLKGASINDLDIGGPFGDTRAQVVLKRDAGIITFRKVPAPPEEMVWHVWAVDGDDQLHSLGTIAEARDLAIVAIDGIDPEEVERIIVTTEPIPADPLADDAGAPGTSDEADAIAEATI